MHPLFFIFFAFPTILSAGWFDWLWDSPQAKKTEFPCPHHCGEWGSESIRSLEWKFVQCLYHAQEMCNYIQKNAYTRDHDHFLHLRSFIPEEYPFPEHPLDFQSPWYQNQLNNDKNLVYDNCNTYFGHCPHCKECYWRILHVDDPMGDHIGKKFIRTLLAEGFHSKHAPFTGDDDDDDSGTTSFYYKKPENSEYKLGNYIDFNNTCLALEDDINTERMGGCRKYHLSPLFYQQIEIRNAKVLQSLKDVRTSYRNIFIDCAKYHESGAAYYNLALDALSKGDYDLALDLLRSLLDKVNVDSLDKNFASELYQSVGSVENEVLLYDEAIRDLSKAIELNPDNKEAFLERAIAYFEKGEYDLALKDFLVKGKQIDFPDCMEEYDFPIHTYTRSFLKGAVAGLKEAGAEFVPSVLNSLRGVGHFLWTTTMPSPELSKRYVASAIKLCILLASMDKAELAEIVFPEMYDLIANWDDLYLTERGEKLGHCLAKHGTDLFLMVAVEKGIKCVAGYNQLQKAEKLGALKVLAESAENRKVLEEAAAKWEAQRKACFERVELEANKQNKHIRGTRSFDNTRSEWTHAEPDKKIKDLAGTGQKIRGEPGEAGYKERVDCGETIGYYVNPELNENDPKKRVLTTMATIHYCKAKDGKIGAHIVPARPKQ